MLFEKILSKIWILNGMTMEIWQLGVAVCIQFGQSTYRRHQRRSAVAAVLALHLLFFLEILRWGKHLHKADDMMWNYSAKKSEEYKSLIIWIFGLSLLQSDTDKSMLSSEREGMWASCIFAFSCHFVGIGVIQQSSCQNFEGRKDLERSFNVNFVFRALLIFLDKWEALLF